MAEPFKLLPFKINELVAEDVLIQTLPNDGKGVISVKVPPTDALTVKF